MKNKIVNFHIPKTAGSSLRFNLLSSIRETEDTLRRVISVDAMRPELGHFPALRAHFTEQFDKLFQPGSQVISGHYRYRDVADIIAPRRADLTLITFLRDPIDRTISDYFYSTSEKHPDREGFLATYPSFADYIATQGQMNKMCDFLRPFEGATAQETLENTLAHFDFVGLTESFDRDFAQIMARLGKAYRPEGRKNVNSDRSPMDAARAAHGAQLREVLADDYVIYDGILARRQMAA